ncbi:MAG: Cell division protein MraZ [uncultured Thiotrichaceae bacterium]|uniref:Transcriptional regulator MraZ n=1 Tax=uncultured Thiotrichaceae bacterium TaxID=298394 RepID=A0A6S6T648_9GAMM|nr:MAG: Cell division protein MraZ [uncultured Thiotrichaceae bacterium]
MFRGITNLNIDTKGRLAIPSRYRDVITTEASGHIVVTVDHTDRCLLVYPMNEWIDLEQKLMKLNNMHRRARNVQRLILGHAHECDLDSQGRILVPAPLREYAGLAKKAVLVGQMKKFELWDAEAWQKQTEAMIEEARSDDFDMDESLNQVSI